MLRRVAPFVALFVAFLTHDATASITVTEQDTSTGAYPLCSSLTSDVPNPIDPTQSYEVIVCQATTGYDFYGLALPTKQQQLALCSCGPLIAKLLVTPVPRCQASKAGKFYSYKAIVEYAFQYCSPSDANPSETPDTTDNTDEPTFAPSPGTVPRATSSSIFTPSAGDISTSESKKEGGTNLGMIVGIGGGVVVLVAIIAIYAFQRGKAKQKAASKASSLNDDDVESGNHDERGSAYTTLGTTTNGRNNSKQRQSMSNTGTRTATGTGAGTRTGTGTGGSIGTSSSRNSEFASGMWQDATIVAMRIPLDLVSFGPLISRGGFGEVYRGVYKNEPVAIKQLLPERRKDLHQIDAFLAEVKLMASLDHERIVRFIGVAWNSLSDLCVVAEYMENGDLRSVLTRFENEERRPHGFDADKLKIALHVAHALTYLHSLQPVVVHRDLKSKNILLKANLDAKVTDFGVSRERADSTMTAGVGSSLWMAPEVMMGERYDEKADVFSFGVVLSELDTHLLPYAQAKETGTGRKMPETAILQLVSLGRLSVDFSPDADDEVVALARACLNVDPRARPSSANVLHRVHKLWQSYL